MIPASKKKASWKLTRGHSKYLKRNRQSGIIVFVPSFLEKKSIGKVKEEYENVCIMMDGHVCF